MNLNIKLGLLDFYQPQGFLNRFSFLIILISVVSAIVTPLQRVTNRRILWKNLAEDQNQRENSSRLISCAVPFIEEYFEFSDQISLLVSDTLDDASALIKQLINKLPVSGTVYALSNSESTDILETYDVSENIVILSKSVINLEKNSSYFVDYCKRQCSFVIMLTNLLADEESFLLEASVIVEQMSLLQSMFKLAILALIEESVLLAGSIPNRIDELYVLAEPTLLGRCQQESTSVIRWQHFKTRPPSNGSVVNAAIFHNFPYAYFIGNKDNMKFGGVEGSMVEEIASNMNLELNRDEIEWQNTTIDAELYVRLNNATDDLVFGGLLWDPNQKTVYMTSYGMVQIVWLIPMKTNVSFRGLITPFSPNVWYIIIGTLFLSGLVKHFLINDITFLDMAALVLGVATNRPKKASSKILFISYCLFGFFLTQLYLGSLADQLQSATDSQIETMEELAKSGLQIGGSQRLAQLLQTPDKPDEQDNTERTLRENFIVFKQRDYTNLFLDIIDGSNTTLALLVMLNLTDVRRLSNLKKAHIMKEDVGSYPLALATWQGFPYLNEFNFKIQILVQGGLVEFWSNMATLNRSYLAMDDEIDEEYIEIDDLAPAFLLLIMGYIGGFFLLIIEVILYPSKLLS